MSAFVVSHAHINALLTFADRKSGHFADIHPKGQRFNLHNSSDLQKLAEILYAQNVRSVHCRYPGDEDVSTLPGVIGEVGKDITFRCSAKTVTPVQALKLLSCYEYQSCETDDYLDSMAHAIIEALRRQAIYALPGYEEAAWEV